MVLCLVVFIRFRVLLFWWMVNKFSLYVLCIVMFCVDFLIRLEFGGIIVLVMLDIVGV